MTILFEQNHEKMAISARVGYARVSSTDQHLDRQLAQFKKIGIEKVFSDKVSGNNTDRPGFQQMMEYVRDGDELYVCSMDRMARNLKDLLSITEFLQKKGVSIHFLKENISLVPKGESSAMTKLLMAMMGAVAEFERSLILERQREGIEQAKLRNAYKGRVPIDPEKIKKAQLLINEGVSKSVAARKLGIGRTTLYKYLKTTSSE